MHCCALLSLCLAHQVAAPFCWVISYIHRCLFFSCSFTQSARFLSSNQLKVTEYHRHLCYPYPNPHPPPTVITVSVLHLGIFWWNLTSLGLLIGCKIASSSRSAVGLWRVRGVVCFGRWLPHLFAHIGGGGGTIAVTEPNYPVLKK